MEDEIASFSIVTCFSYKLVMRFLSQLSNGIDWSG